MRKMELTHKARVKQAKEYSKEYFISLVKVECLIDRYLDLYSDWVHIKIGGFDFDVEVRC